MAGRGVSSKTNTKEILSQQTAGKCALRQIKLTEQSDIRKSSIFNFQSSIVNSGSPGLGNQHFREESYTYGISA
jgi:hypothetical protein